MGKKVLKTISSEDFKKYKHLIGTSMGKVLILDIYDREDSRLRVLTKCLNCGEITIRRLDHLKTDNRQHCIKCQKETSKKKQATTPFNKQLHALKGNAKSRNIGWELTKEDVAVITKQNCYYCGQEPIQDPTNGFAGKHKEIYPYLSNGVDRVDSKKPYSLDNVVPCCRVCNIMKNKFSIDVFFDKISRIYNMHLK